MTARFLYEHLFLAHLKFGTPTNEFYELVRSKTAPGHPIDLIATVRPYDDPGVKRVYYRFRKIHSTIVQKTHMVFDFDQAQLKRINELFIQPAWLETPHEMSYDAKLSANPFVCFAQIPVRSRYQFMLDNSHYFIMTFIHGPVCKGQIALNVIDDHFWIMFVDPDHDPSVTYPGFLKLHSDKLRMPIEKGSYQRLFSAVSDQHRKASYEFYKARQDLYTSLNFAGLDYDSIWKGEPSGGCTVFDRLSPFRQRIGAQGGAGQPAEVRLGHRLSPAGADLLRTGGRIRHLRQRRSPVGDPALHGRVAHRR